MTGPTASLGGAYERLTQEELGCSKGGVGTGETTAQSATNERH